MRLRGSVLVVVILAGSVSASAQEWTGMVGDACVMHSLAGLMREAAMGGQIEAAGFLVLSADGTLSVQPWGVTTSVRHQNYKGVIPQGTVAIVHTHPENWSRPSQGDIAEAMRLHLPVVVLSRSAIRAVDGSGQALDLVTGRVWVRDAGRACAKRVDVSRVRGS